MKKLGKIMICAALAATPVLTLNRQDVAAKGKKVTVKANGKDKKDDTKAIQKALDSVKKGGTVYIPKGTYYATELFIKKNCTIQLNKKATIKKSFYKKFPRGALFTCHLKKKKYGSFSKITITGGTLDGQMHKDNKKNAHKAMDIDHGQNLTIKNMTIKNFSGLHMVEVAAINHLTVDHVTFKNHYLYKNYSKNNYFNGGKNWSVHTCEALQFDSAIKGQTSAYPADKTTNKNVRITNCTFDHVMSGLGTHHNEKKYYKYMHDTVYVANNKFTNVRGDAIHLNNCKNVTVNNNTASNASIFITYYHSFNVNASNNSCTKVVHPLMVDQKSTVTVNNDSYTQVPTKETVANSAPSTVYINDATATLNNCTVEGRSHSIVYSTGSTMNLVGCTLNGLPNSTAYGVLTKSNTNGSIKNCTINGNGSWAIDIHDGNFELTGNTLNGWGLYGTLHYVEQLNGIIKAPLKRAFFSYSLKLFHITLIESFFRPAIENCAI